MISIIVPCFNEEETLDIFYRETKKVIDIDLKMDYEMILIDDGSRDGTLSVMKSLSKEDPCVKYISFSRNFGKEAALYAGLEHAKGEFVAVMDVDLQDPPELLPQMYRAVAEEGYDSAGCRRVSRKGEPPIRSYFAKKFYRIMHRISDTDIMDGARDFRFMTRQVADAILSMEEYNRFSKGIFGWVGFRTKWIPYENRERSAGKTKWSFWKLLLYSIEGMVAFSTKPLMIASAAGVLFCLVSLILMLFLFSRAALYGDPVAGWPSMVCIVTFLGGIQLFCLGITGIYLSKTYLEVKHRPIYLIKEKNTCTIQCDGI